ncbi:UNVERIFIED_CONTAM: hypothetical protein PYX00_006846 [Menopon gallinae]|uniref:Uncharacterized protein n=1 Tax=Menopon gallinae TaxID=328185 RepID=A0AAW2HWM6_9NEOP
MKALALVLVICVCGISARPQQSTQQKEPVQIVSLENEASVDGSYHYRFEAADGTKVEQDGALKDVPDEEGKPSKGEVSQGAYSYVGDDGQTYSVTYTADETGFHPSGAHLPVPPPVPEAIQRALNFLATAPPQKN